VNGWGANIIGTHEQIADFIEDWVTNAAADGFVLADSGLPGQFALFVEHVVSLLRKRGLFRHECRGSTLRRHLGLGAPTRAARPA
jgi:alkanesulfonate monooxygenase SsuD/methylene tetrahydromethanopterin reductase-like flavin-dependent oxidoreductase (luciferase family)